MKKNKQQTLRSYQQTLPEISDLLILDVPKNLGKSSMTFQDFKTFAEQQRKNKEQQKLKKQAEQEKEIIMCDASSKLLPAPSTQKKTL